MIRGETDLEEKFHYICRNPWVSGVVPPTENYPWLWTPDAPGARPSRSLRPASRWTVFQIPVSRRRRLPRETHGRATGTVALPMKQPFRFPNPIRKK